MTEKILSAQIKKRLSAKPGAAGAGEAPAFSLDVQFEAPQGVTIIFGASGSGKTTILKSIAGIIRPDSGSIRVNGCLYFDSDRRIDLPIRKRGAGYVFQNLALFPHLSTLANIEFGIGDLPRRERKRRALSLMDALKIVHTAPRRPHEISGGEAQRVALARALAGSPRLLLLDEPLSAIDEATKLEIINDLKRLNRSLGLPILYVTHSREEAVTIGDQVIILESGRIVAIGEPIAVFSSPAAASVARLTGVENLFRARVVARNEEGGTLSLVVTDSTGSCRVEAPLGRHREGDQVTLAVRSGDILLATEEPRSTSARNILQGCISAVEQKSDRTIVRVTSGTTWAVSVTRQAAGDLRLSEGLSVWLAFKTHSCHLLDQ